MDFMGRILRRAPEPRKRLRLCGWFHRDRCQPRAAPEADHYPQIPELCDVITPGIRVREASPATPICPHCTKEIQEMTLTGRWHLPGT